MDASIAAITQNSVAESERELLGAELVHAEEQLFYYDRVLAAGSLALQKADGQIQISRERLDHIGQRQGKLQGEQETLSTRLEYLDGTLSETEQKLSALSADDEAATLECQVATDLLEQQNEAIKKLEQQIHETRDLVFDQLQEVVDERNNLRQAEREIESLTQQQQRLAREQESLSEQHQAAWDLRRAKEIELQQQDDQLGQITKRQFVLGREKESVEQGLRNLQQQEKTLTNQRQEYLSKRKVLASMQSAYEGFSFGSRSVLKSMEPWRKNVLGAVAQLLTVRMPLSQRLKLLWDNAMQNIVTEDVSRRRKLAVNFFKGRPSGTGTFLPLQSIRAQGARDLELAAASSAGAVGLASSW